MDWSRTVFGKAIRHIRLTWGQTPPPNRGDVPFDAKKAYYLLAMHRAQTISRGAGAPGAGGK